MEAHRLLSGPGGRNPTLAAVTGGKAHPEMASPGSQPFAEPGQGERVAVLDRAVAGVEQFEIDTVVWHPGRAQRDRKSTRLNSSHGSISYAVFCLKKKKKKK